MRESVRFLWGQLTSMRTALVLLFLLALVAIPGSLIPQRPVNPVRVSDFIAANPGLGNLFDTLGLFDVYGSPWFGAVYLLLFISLIGCILPRIAKYVRSARALPARAPGRLERLPEHAAGPTALAASEALDAGEAWLRGRRFRVRRDGGELSAERGYLREFGNLLFHTSLVGALIGVALSSVVGYKGSAIVIEGGAFSNNLSQYDDFSAGGWFNPSTLPPFTVWVDTFDVSFERGPVQRGAARVFRVNGRVAEGAGSPRPATIEVNQPLFVGGSQVNLIAHGYAPVVTVTDAAGAVAFSGPVPFLPQDGQFTSMGIIKAPDARPQRLAFEAIFVPTQTTATGVGPRSTFPDADNPELWGTVWTGDPKVETGRPENVYSLDRTGLTQVMDGASPLSFRLKPGETLKLPGGATLRFDSFKRWTKLQISSTPGLPLTFGSIALAVIGMALSLFVRPRRLYARVTDADGVRRAEVGGQDRAESRSGLDEDVLALAGVLGIEPRPGEDAPEPVALGAVDAVAYDSSSPAEEERDR